MTHSREIWDDYKFIRDVELNGRIVFKEGDEVRCIDHHDGNGLDIEKFLDVSTGYQYWEFLEDCAIHGDFVLDRDLIRMY